jgi:flagellar motor switch protein FliG
MKLKKEQLTSLIREAVSQRITAILNKKSDELKDKFKQKVKNGK